MIFRIALRCTRNPQSEQWNNERRRLPRSPLDLRVGWRGKTIEAGDRRGLRRGWAGKCDTLVGTPGLNFLSKSPDKTGNHSRLPQISYDAEGVWCDQRNM